MNACQIKCLQVQVRTILEGVCLCNSTKYFKDVSLTCKLRTCKAVTVQKKSAIIEQSFLDLFFSRKQRWRQKM